MTAPIARIEPLQALRGLAAFLIMAKHALYEVDLISSIEFNYGDYSNFVVGIDIFFVLSGFIMVYTSWGKSGLGAAKEFMFRRIIRIVPIYWFYTAVLAVIALTIPQVLGKAEFIPIDFLKSLFFIPYLNSAGDFQPLLANGWSLNYEMYFYAVFAACLILPARYSLIALSAFFFAVVFTSGFGVSGRVVAFYSNQIILEFLAGALIGYFFMKGARLPQWCFWLGCVFTVLAMIALLFTNTLNEMGVDYNRAMIAIVMISLLVLPKGAEYIRMPRWSVISGDASYTIYLSHPFAIGAVTQAVLLLGMENVIHPWIVFITIVGVSVGGGIIAYYLLEKPLLSITKSLIKKKQTPAPQESPA